MPTIAFANPKGGAGKTTAALLLAGEIASRGARTTIIDADPERWITQWSKLPGKPQGLDIIDDVTEDTIVDRIEEASAIAQFVIIDLEGTASLMVANAIGMSDLVIIPAQGSSMDGKGAAKTIRLIRNQERLARRSIPHSVLLTRTNPAISTRSLRDLKEQLTSAGIDLFATSIVERAAFRDILAFGGLLSDLTNDQVSNLQKARENALEFASEVVWKLKNASQPESKSAADAAKVA